MINLSQFHKIYIAEEYLHLVKNPPDHDYSLHTIYIKTANNQVLKQADLVIAGKQTRQNHPLAAQYPVHFRKTYFATSLFTDPKREFETTQIASKLLDMPPPIGYDRNTFRNSFIPGKLLSQLSPFGVEPVERNLSIAQEVPLAQLIGLWKLLEQVFAQLQKLHQNHFVHGDLQLHNAIVCTAPIRAFLVDFEVATPHFSGSLEKWEEHQFQDLAEIMKEAIYILCRLGWQDNSPLAEHSLKHSQSLFKNPKPFVKRLQAVGVPVDE